MQPEPQSPQGRRKSISHAADAANVGAMSSDIASGAAISDQDRIHPAAPPANASDLSSSPEPQRITSRSPSPLPVRLEQPYRASLVRTSGATPINATVAATDESLTSPLPTATASAPSPTLPAALRPAQQTPSMTTSPDAVSRRVAVPSRPSHTQPAGAPTHSPIAGRPGGQHSYSSRPRSGFRLPPTTQSSPAQSSPRPVHAVAPNVMAHRQSHPLGHPAPVIAPAASTAIPTGPRTMAFVSGPVQLSSQHPHDPFHLFFHHYVAQFLGSYPMPLPEAQRCEILRRACVTNDLFLLAVHQVTCMHLKLGMQNAPIDLMRELGVDNEASMAISSIFSPSGGITAAFHFAWSDFPHPISVFHPGNDEYARHFASVAPFLKAFMPWWRMLQAACRDRHFPPLVGEMLTVTSSVLLQRLLFAKIIHDVWNGAAAHLMGSALTTFDVDVSNHRDSHYNNTADRIIIQTYQTMFAQLHRPPPSPSNSTNPQTRNVASTTNATTDPFVPQPTASTEMPAVPDPIVYGLHLSHLLDPPIYYRNHSSRPTATYQSINRFILEPTALDTAEHLQEFRFELPNDCLSSRPLQDPQVIEGALRPQRVHVGSRRFRLQCKSDDAQGIASNATMSDWVKRPTYWPEMSVVSVNNTPIELRSKTQFGRCLPSDVSELLKEGENEFKVFNLASVVREIAKDKRPKYTMAIELVEIHSHTGIKHDVMSRVLPFADALTALVRKERSQDDDVVHTKFTMSITDPISATAVWKIPVRGVDCTHAEAFDLEIFLESRRVGKKDDEVSDIDVWKCPICLGDARPDVLVPDAWLLSVRAKLEKDGRLDARRIEISADGDWSIAGLPQRKTLDAKHTKTTKHTAAIEVIELD